MSAAVAFPRWLAISAAGAMAAAAPAFAAIDHAEAQKVFAEAKLVCERDGGAMWGRSLCGPILLVDPTDLSVVANQADAGGVLKSDGAVFVGALPKSAILANTPTEWSGTRWTELLWPLHGLWSLEEDAGRLRVLIAHELFHRVQGELNLSRPDSGNLHLDTLEGRYLLQLEWRALARALQAPDPAARKAAVADALLFRRERYRLFPEAAGEEASLEIAEGIPEYTGVMIGLQTPAERTKFALHDLNAFVSSPTFVRSFAYATGPAYGLLLDGADPAWRGKLQSGQRLDELLGEGLGLPPSIAASVEDRALAYDGAALRTAEVKREEARAARMALLKRKLVDGPVLVLPLAKANYQFNPQTLQALGDYGTVFPTLKVSADWGVLEVSADALFGKDWKSVTVSAAGIDTARTSGDGWTLTMKPTWTIQAGSRAGDLEAVKVSP